MTSTTTISVRLDRSVLKDLTKVENVWHSDRSETIRRLLNESIKEWKIKSALEDLREHKVTISEASRNAGVPLWDMIDLARGIDWIGYKEGDLEEGLKNLGE